VKRPAHAALASVGAAVALAAMTSPARTAHAEEPDEPKPEEAKPSEEARAAEDAKDLELVEHAKGVKLGFRLGVRFLASSPFSHVYQHVLTAYGYNSLSALVEGAGDVAISPWRFLDIGLHTGYAFGTAGSAGGSGGVLTLHELEVGGFACAIFGRTDLRRAGTFGAGVEGGAAFPFLVLRGDVSRSGLPYIAPVLLARLIGNARVQTAIHVRYIIANWSNVLGPVNLPLGGFSISVGANLSL
jgi:hypothetical protein